MKKETWNPDFIPEFHFFLYLYLVFKQFIIIIWKKKEIRKSYSSQPSGESHLDNSVQTGL